MFERIFSGKSENQSAAVAPPYRVEEEGLSYALTLADNEAMWPLAAYLDQLFEEDYVSQLSDRWLLPWESIHQLLDDPTHASSIALLGLPPLSSLQPQLASAGGLSDPDFKVFVQSWRDPQTASPVAFDRTGAMVTRAGTAELLPREVWELLKAMRELQAAQRQAPGETTNQIGWANIRRLARRAGAGLDGFLEKTVVVKPTRLQLTPRKTVVAGTPVIELNVSFDGQPANWTSAFQGYAQVPSKYSVLGDDGTVTQVLIGPDVKEMLQSVRALPGLRVAGDDALSFVRNPFSIIGDAAQQVIDSEEYEKGLADAGIYFHRFRLEPRLNDDGTRIQSITLFLEPIAATPQPEIELHFDSASAFAPFVHELQVKFAAGLPAGFWEGHELELSDFDEAQLSGIDALLRQWQRQEADETFAEVLDLSAYGDRVVGIGEAERITSPFLMRKPTDWLAGEMGDADGTVDDDGKGDSHKPPGGDTTEEHPQTARVQIEHNIEEATYAQSRGAALVAARDAKAGLPASLRPEVRLREHQLQGVAWLQHLFRLSPDHVAGCLLADDMGLGKTIQLLTFAMWYLEQQPQGQPVLIVAPVSLLDNWERELRRFFDADALPVLKLYGAALSAAKFAKREIPADLQAKGIRNLLRPGWMGGARIVLTTYETLRDQELSLARQQWAIVICDEAQKIKNPAALVTQAAKAVPARFRVACTGTPVENTLIDLWCLFDFIQPGFLGSMNQFGREYLRPIETGQQRDVAALERLRSLIEPQTLRRTKQDVAKDLPAKIEDAACRTLPMHALQRQLYLSEVGQYRQQRAIEESLDQRGAGMLGLLQRLKRVCAHPYSVEPDPRLLEHSPKLQWLMRTLEAVERSGSGDKVIVFTELRDIQRELQHAVQKRFGFKPTVINGDTSTSSESARSRQRLIDQFQDQPGFSVIILSPVAVGFGVNVQAANHVIHFTRCWNPAKEDQATDRAYRIGQEKDVYVYYPTVCDAGMPTFETTLDALLTKRRALARDMFQASAELQAAEFEELLQTPA